MCICIYLYFYSILVEIPTNKARTLTITPQTTVQNTKKKVGFAPISATSINFRSRFRGIFVTLAQLPHPFCFVGGVRGQGLFVRGAGVKKWAILDHLDPQKQANGLRVSAIYKKSSIWLPYPLWDEKHKNPETRGTKMDDLGPVSYTHLTLPTICSV